MALLVVTTGATATFVPLIESVLDAEFLETCIRHGIDRVVVQYGTEEPKSKQVYDTCVSPLKDIKHFAIDESRIAQLTVEGIPYDPDFTAKYIAKADIVLSHAGTGSILDALRLGKKLIVVINDKLADNHQLEIAQAFEDMGVLLYARNTAELPALLEKIGSTDLQKLDASQAVVESIVIQELSQ